MLNVAFRSEYFQYANPPYRAQMPAAKTVMTTAFRCTPKAKSRRVPSNKHRKAVAPPITLKAKSTQLSIMASAEVPEGNRHLMLLRWCPGQGSNLHDGITRRGILSPLCLPVSPPGRKAWIVSERNWKRVPSRPVVGGGRNRTGVHG